MRIEVLYISGCPNVEPALERLREVLAEEGVDGVIEQVAIDDPAAARARAFPGSPTMRIAGVDVDASAILPALTCRTYAVPGGRSGVPGKEAIRRAISNALRSESDDEAR